MSSQDGIPSSLHEPSQPDLSAADDSSSTAPIAEITAARIAAPNLDGIATDEAVDDGAIENAFVGDVADEAAEFDLIIASEIPAPALIIEPKAIVEASSVRVVSVTAASTGSDASIVSEIVSAVVAHAERNASPVVVDAPARVSADAAAQAIPSSAPLISAIMAAVVEHAAQNPSPAIASAPEPVVAKVIESPLPIAAQTVAAATVDDEIDFDEADEFPGEEAFFDPELISEPAAVEAAESHDDPVEASAPISEVPTIEESMQPSPPRWKGLIRRPAFLRRREEPKQKTPEAAEAVVADEAFNDPDDAATFDPVIEEAAAGIASTDDTFTNPDTAAIDEYEDEFEEDDEPSEVGSTGGGWTIPMLCLGIAVIACCLIIPQADVNRRIAYERQALRQDLESVQTQVATNDEFLRKLAADPQLSERLAQRQLKLTRAGDKLLPIVQGDAGTSPFDLVQVTPPRQMEPYQPTGGTIATICYNPHTRLYLMGVGLFIMAAGLVLGVTPPSEMAQSADSTEVAEATCEGQKIPARLTIDGTPG